MWLRWGLSSKDLDGMPPTIVQGFAADTKFSAPKRVGPLGKDIGPIGIEDGSSVEGGKILMKDEWNSEVFTPLAKRTQRQDLDVYKNRLNGFWGGTGIEEALSSRGIRTLLFASCNTDQCVAGSM